MLSGFNLGDALFQLFSLAFIVVIIALIVSFFRSNKKRKSPLDQIEKKMDEITGNKKTSFIMGIFDIQLGGVS